MMGGLERKMVLVESRELGKRLSILSWMDLMDISIGWGVLMFR